MEEIEKLLKYRKDFPKKGILYVDIMPLFRDQYLITQLMRVIKTQYEATIDAVVGLESRGFLFGEIIAWTLDVPFIPIRKKGKLPFPVSEISSVKEYGEDVLEIGEGITPSDRILIHDDLLATGGTINAATELVESCGGIVEAINVIVDLGLPEAEHIRKMQNFLAFHKI